MNWAERAWVRRWRKQPLAQAFRAVRLDANLDLKECAAADTTTTNQPLNTTSTSLPHPSFASPISDLELRDCLSTRLRSRPRARAEAITRSAHTLKDKDNTAPACAGRHEYLRNLRRLTIASAHDILGFIARTVGEH